MITILAECCSDFGKSEKVFDFLQILSNNSLFNTKSIKDFCKLYFNIKNKTTKNKTTSQININNNKINFNSNDENTLLNSFEQEATNINNNSSSAYIDNTNTINIDNFISRLKDRLKYMPLLLSQVDYMCKFQSLKSEILNEFRSEKKFQIVKEKSKITNARRISKIEFYLKQEEILNLYHENFKFSCNFNSENSEKIYEKISSSNDSNNFDLEAVYICVEFERKNYRINAFAEVRYDFPNFAPRFILSLENTKNNSNNNNLNYIPGELMEFVNKENNLEDFKSENCGFSNILRVKIKFYLVNISNIS